MFDRVRKHAGYAFRYPGMLPRAAENYVRRIFLRQPRLRGVEFALEMRCQCQCEHCSLEPLKKNDTRPPLSHGKIVDVLRECRELGALNINLTGGEFLLRDDAEALIRAADPKHTVVSVATNGMLLTPETCRMLKRAGTAIVTISIDSADPAKHDAFRGLPGCHEQVLAGARHARDAGLEVFLCTVMTRENALDGDMRRMLELARGVGAMLTVNLPCPVGRWLGKDVALDAGQRRFHSEFLKEKNVRWEGYSNYFKPGCPAGIEKIYLSVYGDVMPCNFMHISYGNLHDRPLGEIWTEMLERGPFNRVVAGCPISDDRGFVAEYIGPMADAEQLPMPHTEHPVYRRD